MEAYLYQNIFHWCRHRKEKQRNIVVSWNVTAWNLVVECQSFWGTRCLHFQGLRRDFDAHYQTTRFALHRKTTKGTWTLIHFEITSNKQILFNAETNSVELNTSREAASCEATRKFPNILWNPKVYYRVHKSPQLIPILSQINSVHTNPSYLSEIHFNDIHLPLNLPSGLFPFGFPTNIIYAFLCSQFVLHVLTISSPLIWSF
jgi:hypothetical protein